MLFYLYSYRKSVIKLFSLYNVHNVWITNIFLRIVTIYFCLCDPINPFYKVGVLVNGLIDYDNNISITNTVTNSTPLILLLS